MPLRLRLPLPSLQSRSMEADDSRQGLGAREVATNRPAMLPPPFSSLQLSSSTPGSSPSKEEQQASFDSDLEDENLSFHSSASSECKMPQTTAVLAPEACKQVGETCCRDSNSDLRPADYDSYIDNNNSNDEEEDDDDDIPESAEALHRMLLRNTFCFAQHKQSPLKEAERRRRNKQTGVHGWQDVGSRLADVFATLASDDEDELDIGFPEEVCCQCEGKHRASGSTSSPQACSTELGHTSSPSQVSVLSDPDCESVSDRSSCSDFDEIDDEDEESPDRKHFLTEQDPFCFSRPKRTAKLPFSALFETPSRGVGKSPAETPCRLDHPTPMSSLAEQF